MARQDKDELDGVTRFKYEYKVVHGRAVQDLRVKGLRFSLRVPEPALSGAEGCPSWLTISRREAK
jgi:hypothetical protein